MKRVNVFLRDHLEALIIYCVSCGVVFLVGGGLVFGPLHLIVSGVPLYTIVHVPPDPPTFSVWFFLAKASAAAAVVLCSLALIGAILLDDRDEMPVIK